MKLNNRSLLTHVSGAALCLLTSAMGIVAQQQQAARPDRGIMPGASYSVSETENISLTNGNLNLSIPLASLPTVAGGKLKFGLSAIYNSKLWNVTRVEHQLAPYQGCANWMVNTPQKSDAGGWRITGAYAIEFRLATADFHYYKPQPPPPADPCQSGTMDMQEQQRRQYDWYRAILIMPDGAEHELKPVDASLPYTGESSFLKNYYRDIPGTLQNSMRYYSIDGSYLWAVINADGTWTVYQNDGTRITQAIDGVQRIQDTNGNSIKIFSDTEGAHYQNEQTGREIKVTMDWNANGGDGKHSIQYQTVNGGWQTVEVNYDYTHVQGKIYPVSDFNEINNHVCERQELLGANLWVIREIVFPVTEPGVPARRYSFGYNSDTSTSETVGVQFACGSPYQSYTRNVSPGMGGLSHMVTPTGAVVDYKYSRDLTQVFQFDTDDIPRETVTEKRVTHDGVTDTWTYAITESGGCGGTITEPDGSVITENCFTRDTSSGGYLISPKGGLSYRTNNSNKTIVERHWTLMKFYGANSQGTGVLGETTINPVVDAEYTTLLDDTPSHNPVKMSVKTFQYDFNGNLLSETNYDWFDPTGIQRDTEGVPIGVPGGALLRSTTNTYHNPSSEWTSSNVYAKRALSATPLILSAVQQTTSGPAIAQFIYDNNAYDVAPTIGNVTSKKVWDDLDNKWITTASTYDSYGNVRTTTDGRGKITTYDYLNPTLGLPTSVTVDPQNGTGAQTSYTAYDQATGLVTSTTDANGQTTSIDYTNQLFGPGTFDPFGRPGVVIGPLVNANGVSQHHRTTTYYEDSLRRVTVASDLNTENDQMLKSRVTSDALGRTVLTERTEDGTNYTIYSRKAYDQMGKITYSSAPMRYGVASSTDSWTRVTTDVLDRPTEVATFGGSSQPVPTGTPGAFTGQVTTVYDANTVTVTDQAGKERRSASDGLGRLTNVYEDPNGVNYGTSYDYDSLGNLRHVYQGSQTRTFTYDSLSRLRTANNPESGTISYVYDDNGNLTSKTDARAITTNFVYDSLNRATSRSYQNDPNSTPTVTYTYDTLSQNGKGRLTSVASSVSSYSYSGYDAVGKVLSATQTIYGPSQTSQSYTVTYDTYDLAGHVKTMTYPSGRQVTNAYDNAGRLQSLSGNLAGSQKTYASGIVYDAGSRMTREQLGTTTPIYNKLFYNSRGQLAEIREGFTPNDTSFQRGAIINFYAGCWGMCWDPNTGTGNDMPNNNGNLKIQQTQIPNDDNPGYEDRRTDLTHFFEYDSLNRIQFTSQGNWREEYLYDQYGNRRVNTNSQLTYGLPNITDFDVETATNRLQAPGQSGWSESSRSMRYDAAGNLWKDTYSRAALGQTAIERRYDGENRMIKETQAGNYVAGEYAYDGDGRRVRRVANNVETWQVYGAGGELIAEYSANGVAANPQKEYGYRNGQLLITATVTAGWGAAPSYTGPNPLSPGDDIKLENLTELRTAVNSLRAHAGLAAFNFTVDSSPVRNETTVKADHIRQLRTALEQARSQLGLSTGGYAHPTLTENSSLIYAIDFQELRNQIASAWNSSDSVDVRWLVPDQLGTPRMIFDQSGSLANTKRHDYLPFGEEIYAGTGGRATGMGYTVQGYPPVDRARQKFTSKERDDETGLDYFLARYYSSTQGRFTSPDEFKGGPAELYENVDAHDPVFYAETAQPQTLNKYHYCVNNPLRFVDPDGHQEVTTDIIKTVLWANVQGRMDRGSISRGVTGAVSAWAEDNGLPTPGGRQNKVGRAIGHGLAIAQGVAEMADGAAITSASGGEVVASLPVCAGTGVGCAATAGGVVVAAAGATIATHGGFVVINTASNIFSKKTELSKQKKDYSVEGTTEQLTGLEKKQETAVKQARGTGVKQKQVESKGKSKQNVKKSLKDYKDQYNQK